MWDLTGYDSPTRITNTGVRGLQMPPIDRFTSESPAIAGSRWRGSRTTERSVFWPLFIYSDASSAAWLEVDRAFWRTMRPDQTGIWTVTTPDGQSRRLVCRYSELADDSIARDPFAQGWMLYGVTLIAEQPFWLGRLQTRSVRVGTPGPFFGGPAGSGFGPPFFISSGSALVDTSIDNPGDMPAPPVFVLDGPWDSGAAVGIGSAVTTYNAAVPVGSSVVIDTRPATQGARLIPTPVDDPGSPGWWATVSALSGTSVFESVGTDVALSIEVPEGLSQRVSVNAAGAGVVHVALEPRFYRAWG